MGVCRNEEAVDVNQDYASERKRSNKKDDGPAQNFPDIEEFDGNLYKGVGIKRMKGYKCNLSINKLNAQNESFELQKTKMRIGK